MLKPKLAVCGALAFMAMASATSIEACTRGVYLGSDGLVITGRSMDWMEDISSNMWVFPRAMQRDGAAGPQSAKWTSKYGSLTVAGYDKATTDGMNEKGFVANLLYLADADYGKPDGKPLMSVTVWAQYMLDNYATVAEAVADWSKGSFTLLGAHLPNGSPAVVHLAISDPSGDSAVFEYVKGELKVHHGKQYQVMTNEPPMEEQAALNAYWERVGGDKFLPGTIKPEDRFVRTSFFIKSLPKTADRALVSCRSRWQLRQSGHGRRDERDARDQHPVRAADAGRAEQRIDAMAHRGRSEEPRLHVRFSDQPQRLLGVARRTQLQGRALRSPS